MMNKKAQGLSMNMIIIAALALIVLVVISVIFMGKSADFVKKSDDCIVNGGQCLDAGPNVCAGNYERVSNSPCFMVEGGKQVVDTDKVCCISIQ